MDHKTNSDHHTTLALAIGLVAAVAAAGVVGALLHNMKHAGSEQVRDVKDIITQCQTTIGKMDRALNKLTASTSKS